MKQPNVLFIFADQWRAQACGYAGDPNVKTPNLDALAGQSINCVNAYSGCPVCSPYRASFLTGRPPHHHGVFVNDVCLSDEATSIAQAFSASGYDTAYVGKWHVDGHGRQNYIPPQRRQGFDYWKVLECTHNYQESPYYAHDSEEKLTWEGYDALAQTRDVEHYLQTRKPEKPFFMVLSWGPPHSPLGTAPAEFQAMYDADAIELRLNVPAEVADKACADLAGYYAHCTALDTCIGSLLRTLDAQGLSEDTIVVFTSDHGDMLGSQGQLKKQRPYAESIRVPFLLRYPRRFGDCGKEVSGFLDAPDIMPTLLSLCEIPIPETVEGRSFAEHFAGDYDPSQGMGRIACYHPFGQFTRQGGGREYRGIVTEQYTYVKTLDGPWLLYDEEHDPYQQVNRVGDPALAEVQRDLDARLDRLLEQESDRFQHGDEYIAEWGYPVNENGTVPYTG